MNSEKLNKININFIVGLGRSGTTLLVVLLNQYDNCIATPEIHHFIHFYKKYKNIDYVSQELIDDYKDYINRYFQYKKNPLIGPSNSTLIDSLEIGQKINYSQLTKLIYLGLFGQKGINNNINVIVDKNPYYTLEINKILKIFPDAKLLALIRDPRGYVLSNIQSKRLSVSKKDNAYHAFVWRLFMKKIVQAKKLYDSNIKIICYEDIALEKEKTLKEITNYFNLEYSESIFNFNDSIKEKINSIKQDERNYERMHKKLKDLSSPINSERVHAWKNDLTKNEIEQIEFIAGSLGNNYNYFNQTHISYLKKISILISSIISFIKVKVFETLKSPELHIYHNYKIKNAKK